MSDDRPERPDPERDARLLANRLETAGLETRRFIDVNEDEKKSVNHTRRDHTATNGNYGVYAGDGLVDVDIDEYGDDAPADRDGLDAIHDLPETLTIESPHTDGEAGGHRYYHVTTEKPPDEYDTDRVLARYFDDDGEPTATYEAAKDDPVALALAAAFGPVNPQPSWGEVRAVNQYVVGPGSQIDKGPDGCDKEWCDRCADADGGYYRIATDVPIATVDVETFIDALRADPALDERTTDAGQGELPEAADGGVDVQTPTGGGPSPDVDDDAASDVLGSNPWIGVYLSLGADETKHGARGDRSALDYAACKELAKGGVSEEDAHGLLNESEHTKVHERGDGYWSQTWNRAVDDVTDDGGQGEPGEPDIAVELCPSTVAGVAGLGKDEDVSDLNDRQKAASVWDLLQLTDEFHIRVRRDNGSLWAYDDGIWKPDGERALRHAGRRALGSMNYGQNVLAELKAQARGDPRVEVEADEFGVEPGTFALENGLVDLEAAAGGDDENAIRDLRPDDYALARLPVEHDPHAPYDEWASLVEEWAEDGRADALQEYVGYCLHVGAVPIHRALLLVGSGANGKGTFLSVVRSLLGRDNTTSIELQTLANEKDAVADFYGSIANIDDDLSARKLGRGLGMFKKLVAGDRVRARRLYEDGFEYDATGKHLYAANGVPDVSDDVNDDDEAFWRRWLLVEFPNHYPPSERDPGLRDRLTEPETLSGVLNWAIEGWARLLDQGHFTNEERHAFDKRERWQAWGESVDKFISEHVKNDPDADRLTTTEAHRRYAAWCRENNEDPVGQRDFTNTLKNEDVGYKSSIRINGKVERGYDALGLSDDVPALESTPERGAASDAEQDSLF